MNYYQHHIGDFNNATRHLSLVERAIYRDLLDMYYDTEKAIDASNMDRLARRLQCITNEQIAALNYILDEFFILQDGAYLNNRCEREIAEFHGKRKQASDAGKASAKKRAAKKQQPQNNGSSDNEQSNDDNSTDVEQASNENLTDVQPTNNHKPLTNNQEPFNSGSSNAHEQKNPPPPIQFSQYQSEDHKRYTLLGCVNQYPIQNDFIELAQARFENIPTQDLITLFSGGGMFCDFFSARGNQSENTASIWLVKWFTWIENNKDQVKRNREKQNQAVKQSVFTNKAQQAQNEIDDWLSEINPAQPEVKDVHQVFESGAVKYA